MKEEDLTALLQNLPRHQASEGFTSCLLNKLPTRRPSTVLGRRPVFVLVACILLLVTISLGTERWLKKQRRMQAKQRIEALRNEYQELEKELEELRRLAARTHPVLTLENKENLRFVIDLPKLAQETGKTTTRPVNFRH